MKTHAAISLLVLSVTSCGDVPTEGDLAQALTVPYAYPVTSRADYHGPPRIVPRVAAVSADTTLLFLVEQHPVTGARTAEVVTTATGAWLAGLAIEDTFQPQAVTAYRGPALPAGQGRGFEARAFLVTTPLGKLRIYYHDGIALRAYAPPVSPPVALHFVDLEQAGDGTLYFLGERQSSAGPVGVLYQRRPTEATWRVTTAASAGTTLQKPALLALDQTTGRLVVLHYASRNVHELVVYKDTLLPASSRDVPGLVPRDLAFSGGQVMFAVGVCQDARCTTTQNTVQFRSELTLQVGSQASGTADALAAHVPQVSVGSQRAAGAAAFWRLGRENPADWKEPFLHHYRLWF